MRIERRAERASGPTRVVWRFSDGRPGHDNQSLGLVEALGRRLPVEVHTLVAPKPAAMWRNLFLGRFPAGERLPDPWLLIGAGRRTHLPLLAGRRARRGRTVVLMRPTFPCSCYDLCIIPEHDSPVAAPGVLMTRGSLNRVQRITEEPRVQGMILVGGPSRHHRWRDEAVAAQIARVMRATPAGEWVLATSCRTPQGFAERLGRELGRPESRLTVSSWERTDDGGRRVAQQLVRSRCVWVTEDSVSMVYEALTAGVATGLLEVPARGRDRVAEGIHRLVASGQLTCFRDWAAGRSLQPPTEVFDEANRCAEWICAHWGATSNPG